MEPTLDDIKRNGTWFCLMTKQPAWGITDLISNMGSDITGIEIGVQIGLNSMMLIDICTNISKIYGIDPYIPFADCDGRFITQAEQDHNLKLLDQSISAMGNKFKLLKMKSFDAANMFENEAYDFVFIDGDKSSKNMLTDLTLYAPKVKQGGVIAGHDIGFKSVSVAIQAWARGNNIDFNTIHIIENQSWYWIKT